MRRLTVILGVPIDEVTLVEALNRIEGFVRRSGRLHQVVTVNSDFLARARADAELLHILRHADLATADGMPLVWASRLLGGGIPERVAGADLVPALAERCAANGHSLFLLGALPEVAREAADRLRRRFPGLNIAGVYSPPPADLAAMDDAEILRRVHAARPDVLLVAFGNPKQEKWIFRRRHDLGVPVAIGVGGSLDFIAGKTRRAPLWMRRSGTEWLWRLGSEPRRLWRRYAHDIHSLAPALAWSWVLTRRTRRRAPATEGVPAAGPAALAVRGALDAGQRPAFEALALKSLREAGRVEVDLSGCTYLDSAGLGCLASLAHEARARGAEVRIAPGPPAVRRLLRLGGLHAHLGAGDDLEAMP